MKNPRATFIKVCWKVGTVDYYTPQAWGRIVAADPRNVLADAVSITRKRKAYTIENGVKVPTNYTTRN